MTSLSELQTLFRSAVLGGDGVGIEALVRDDELGAGARVDIYRNNVFASLHRVLKTVFPVVCRIVDDRFFSYASDEFIRAHPPQEACLSAYGGCFADFLACFPPCRELVYLPDVARLEWNLNLAAQAADAEPMAPANLSVVSEAETERLVFGWHSSVSYLSSPWPVDRVWRANRGNGEAEAIIDLDVGGVRLEVGRDADRIVYRVLTRSAYEFRTALADGKTLESAVEIVLSQNLDFDPASEISALFRDGVVVGFSIGGPLQGE